MAPPGTGVGASYSETDGSAMIHEWIYRLGHDNSVYQAELFAIYKALLWNLQITSLKFSLRETHQNASD